MKRKRKYKLKKQVKKPVRLKSYTNGGVGQGQKALVHTGEIVLHNPFRKP